MNINVHIERLILDGLPITRSQGQFVQATVETELARLLAADGLAPGLRMGGAMRSVPAESIQLTQGNDPGHLGRQIAQAVYGGIGGSRK
jgi:hypothetical protein